MYRIMIIFVVVINLMALNVDPNLENSLSKYDIQNRLLLVRYYMNKHNYQKAQKFNDEILAIDPKNSIALLNKRRIEAFYNLNNILKGEDANTFYKRLYYAKNYKAIKALTPYLAVIKSDYPKIITAKIYMKEGKYKQADDLLKLVKNKRNNQYREVKGYTCFALGDYKCSKRMFSILFNTTGNVDYAYKLIDSMMYLGETNRVNMLLKRYPNNAKFKKLKEMIEKRKQSQLQKLEAQYKKTHSFNTLQEIVYILFKNNQQQKAYKMLDDYILQFPMDRNAKYWYAKYLMWYGHNDEALKLLNQIVTKEDYKTKYLMAQIYAWTGRYQESFGIIDDIMKNAKDKNLILDAAELKALMYYWQHNYDKAKPLLEEVLKHKKSNDAKEALMVINGDLKPLIKKYKELANKDITNATYALKVAQYAELDKDIPTAIEYYEKYFTLKPDMNIAHKLGKYYLTQNNYNKGFAYYRQWAYSQKSVESLYELAKSYYYYGYSDKALKVIKDILALQPYEPAVKLKRIILSSPKKSNCRAYYKKGLILEKNGQIELAKKMYNDGLKVAEPKKHILKKPKTKHVPLFVQSFINHWKHAWESKKISRYKTYYDSRYRKNRRWLRKKSRIFRHAKYIKVEILDLKLVRSYKRGGSRYYIVKFYQKYTNGRKKDGGYKTLTIRCKNNKCKIYKEYWRAARYIPPKKITYRYPSKPDTRCKELINIRLLALKKGNYYALSNLKKKKDNDGYLTEKGIWLISKKKLEKLEKVFGIVDINLTKKLTFQKGNVKYRPSGVFNGKYGVKGYYYTDKEKIYEYDNGVYFDNKYVYLDFKYWKLWKLHEKRFGRYTTIKFKYGKIIKLGAEIGSYNTKNDKHNLIFYLHPNLEYKTKNGIKFQYFQSVTGRVKQSFCATDKGLKTDTLSISKYVGSLNLYDKDITKFLYAVDLSKTQDNITLTPQFIYRFKPYNRFKKLELYYFLSGWYQANSKPTDCYYSPKLYDSTFVEIHPVYGKFELIGKVGYSIKKKNVLKTIGMDYTGEILTLGCRKNFTYKEGKDNYWYLECYLDAGVKW